jgi:hypothetical protein
VRGFVVSHTATVPKNPLRRISSRIPYFSDTYNDGTMKLMWFTDTLECGHQQVVYPFDAASKRHRCAECAEAAAFSPKKPVQSTAADAERKRA